MLVRCLLGRIIHLDAPVIQTKVRDTGNRGKHIRVNVLGIGQQKTRDLVAGARRVPTNGHGWHSSCLSKTGIFCAD